MVRVVIGSALLAAWFGISAASTPTPPQSKQIARGKYLVEKVSMCIDCHTPRGEKGALDQTRWLQGAILDFKPINPVPVWAEYAPPLAGLPGWTNDQAITFLETGRNRTGNFPRPPMPPFRMSRSDAAAVVAYLKSLRSASP